jgi:hypothetical protein
VKSTRIRRGCFGSSKIKAQNLFVFHIAIYIMRATLSLSTFHDSSLLHCRVLPFRAAAGDGMTLGSLSDQQTKEVAQLFRFFDNNRDGLISPRSATKLCERLGFHPEPLKACTPLTLRDVLSWCNSFCGQCSSSDELRTAQRFALLRSCDPFASGQRISRTALENFLVQEQHTVRPEVIDALLQDLGTDGQHLTKADLKALVAKHSRGQPGRPRGPRSTNRVKGARDQLQ